MQGETLDTEANEVTELQQELEAKRLECSQLQETLGQISAQKAAAHEATLSGIKAAKTQMQQLRSELALAKRWIEEHSPPDGEGGYPAPPEEGSIGRGGANSVETEAPSQEEAMWLRSLQVQARELRHELTRWKHQVDLHEAKRPKQEDEIISLKAELTHTLDIHASTQHAVRHAEVEREFQKPAEGAGMDGNDNSNPHQVSLHGGGHGHIQAHAERQVRERAEDRNIKLSGKAKRLSGVVAAQQLLIQRLEKQVLQEERALEQKDRQLDHGAKSIAQLRSMVRQQSDAHVAGLLGIATVQMSASAPKLPTI